MKKTKKYKSNSTKELNRKQNLKRPTSTRNDKNNLNKVINVNLFRIPFESINTELKDIKKIIENENSKNTSDKLLIKNTNINIAKENIIMSLRKELKFQKLLNKNLINFKEYADTNSKLYKKNYDNIYKYKAHLQSELSEFINLMNNYEKQKRDYEEEKNTMIKTNENLLNYKRDEQYKMKNKLDKLNYDTKNQYDTIEKLRNALRDFRNQNNNYIVNLEKNESEHDYRYEKLLKEYKRVENQYKYYLDLDLRNRKNRLDGMNKNLYAEEEGMAVLQLSENQVKGEYLKNIITDIQSHIKEIEQFNKKVKEDKEIEKFLGKRGAEEYKQRMNEKYKNEISSINSNFNFSLSSF